MPSLSARTRLVSALLPLHPKQRRCWWWLASDARSVTTTCGSRPAPALLLHTQKRLLHGGSGMSLATTSCTRGAALPTLRAAITHSWWRQHLYSVSSPLGGFRHVWWWSRRCVASTKSSIAAVELSQPQPAAPLHFMVGSWWWWRQWLVGRPPTPGRGFDNFIPKQHAASETDESNTTANVSTKKDNPNNSNKKNSNSNNSDPWIAWAILLGIVYLVQRFNNNSNSNNSNRMNNSGGEQQQSSMMLQREISWHEFLRLLQQGDILKIVVTKNGNNSASTTTTGSGGGSLADQAQFGTNTVMARIYLKPHATGLASTQQQQRRTMARAATGANDPATSTTTSHSDGSAQVEHDRMEGLSNFDPQRPTDPQHHLQQQPLVSYRMAVGSLESFERKLDEAQRALAWPESKHVPVQYMGDRSMTQEILAIVPGLILAAIVFAMMRYAGSMVDAAAGGGGSGGGGGIFSIGRSTAKKIKKEDIKVTFADVAGCDEAKKEIMEFVDFLKDSSRFTNLGAKIPKGALLSGPPGTGKTLLAKAVAGEAAVPFYSVSGSDFIEMFVGVGPSRVRDLFAEARANAPCIVFIDEIDAVGRQRGKSGMGSNDERENTLNQLLVEMDGFTPSTGVVVLAGTNRVDILDQALTRPGRFDRQILVDKPDLKGRQAIFLVHLKGIVLEGSMDDVASRLAGLTPGFAGADIANICNEAAIVAARRKGETVTMEDFEKATDRIVGGLESNKIMSKEERSIVAHHEAGHAVAGWFLEHADALLKVTIIPRSSGALGFAQYLPKEVYLRTQDQIMDTVCMALAGRAAEEIFFGTVTTGASDDLKRVTALVYSTIQLYGMNRRLGQLSFPKDPNAMFEDRPYSEKTTKAMDEEAKLIVDAAYERTLTLLRSKKDDVEKVAKLLLDKETIVHDDIEALIGARPFQGDPAYEEFIRRRRQKPTTDSDTIVVDQTNDEETIMSPPATLTPSLS